MGCINFPDDKNKISSDKIESKELEIQFFLKLEESKNYWIGDLIRLYDINNNLLLHMSQYSAVQNGQFVAPNLVSLDIIDENWKKNRIEYKDFIVLGRPNSHSTYLKWVNGQLIAKVFEREYYKDNIDKEWKPVTISEYDEAPHYQTIRLGKKRILKLRENSFIQDCELLSDETFNCSEPHRDTNRTESLAYSYYIIGDSVHLFMENGDVYTYDLQSKMFNQIVHAHRRNISNQFYSSLFVDSKIWLGHYPSGGVFNTDGHTIQMPFAPPIREGYRPYQRETQSLGYIGGKLIAGIWPWGEVWEIARRSEKMTPLNVIPLFSAEDDVSLDHPFEGLLTDKPYDYNELGRRISSSVPCWQGICLSTSTKSVMTDHEIKNHETVSQEILSEYGRVFYIPGPKVNFNFEFNREHIVNLRLSEKTGEIKIDGHQVCFFSFEQYDLSRVINLCDRIELLSPIGEKNGHSAQIQNFIRR